MQQQSINELYSDFISEILTRTEFEGLLYKYLLINQEKTCLIYWNRDEYEDYISWIYPRLHKAIDTYRDIGASFQAYILKYLTVSSKEYRVSTATNAITEKSAWKARLADMYVHEESPVYKCDNIKKGISQLITKKKSRTNTRRILTLLIKCYYYISDDFAEKIAPRIGIDSNELLEMLKKIRTIRQEKDDKIYYMKERTNTQFIRCMVYEKRLSYIKDNINAYNSLKNRLERARKRLEKMRARITNIRAEATNSQVAEVIGITKGTVDANLHKLKERWKTMSQNANLN